MGGGSGSFLHVKFKHSVYPLAAGGAGDFIKKFPLEGEAGKFWVCRGGCPFKGAPKSRWAGDFVEFCKNLIEKF